MNAPTATPLSLAERKARLAELAAMPEAPADVAGMIDLREPTARERAYGLSLEEMAREVLSRDGQATA